MRIIECCPYYNEQQMLELKVDEGSSWIDEFRIAEASHTFKFKEKGFNLQTNSHKVTHLKLDGNQHFVKDFIGLKRSFPFIGKKSGAWRNEGVQRNYATEGMEPAADDIVILSDIDEIIDARHADYLVELVKKHKIITVKLHFTMFYMNLFSTNWHEVWPGSPPDYAYRTYLMTGDYFNNLKWSSDTLRHMGESSKFVNSIHCPDNFMGFHHSWLGSDDTIYNKLMSYAHDIKDHGQELVDAYNQGDLKSFISNRLAQGQSIFANHKLEKKSQDSVQWLRSISSNKASYEKHFI